LDLLEGFSSDIHSAYCELNESVIARSRFKTAVEGAVKLDEGESKEMVLRIERIGKGRFAQRLAEKVGTKEPPAYIKGAIERIVRLVEENHA
jgi:hypothetical protein